MLLTAQQCAARGRAGRSRSKCTPVVAAKTHFRTRWELVSTAGTFGRAWSGYRYESFAPRQWLQCRIALEGGAALELDAS